MSVPWNTLGYDIPYLEDAPYSGPTGDGTDYPVVWDKTYGSSATNQIVRFCWHAAVITVSISGSATLSFVDSGLSHPPEDFTFTFSFNGAVERNGVPTSGTADQLEPGGLIYSDLATMPDTGSLTGTTTVTPTTVTTSWGDTCAASLGVNFSMEGNILPIGSIKPDGLNYSSFVQKIIFNIGVGGSNFTDPLAPCGGVGSSLKNAGGTLTPLTTISFLHANPQLYWEDNSPSSVNPGTLSVSASVSVTSELGTPPDI